MLCPFCAKERSVDVLKEERLPGPTISPETLLFDEYGEKNLGLYDRLVDQISLVRLLFPARLTVASS
jgi:hypothetical protein